MSVPTLCVPFSGHGQLSGGGMTGCRRRGDGAGGTELSAAMARGWRFGLKRGDLGALSVPQRGRGRPAACLLTRPAPGSAPLSPWRPLPSPWPPISVFSPQILQADGGTFCAGVNAATLAVMDAGIPMRDYVCASTAGLAEDAALADLSVPEEAAGGPVLALALLPAGGQLAQLQLSARLHQERLPRVLEAAGAACRALHAVLDRVVRQRLREVAALLGD